MNKKEFIEELKTRLHKLPEEETQNAVNYYEEYFEEAGEENKEKVLEELGSPAEIASQIIGNFAIKETNSETKSKKSGLSTIWIVILAIFASPIALPLALAVVAVVIALIISLVVILFSLSIAGIAAIFIGMISVIASVTILFQHIPTTIFVAGYGMFCIGFGMLLVIGVKNLSRICFSGITKIMGKFLLRRSKK